ncbi:MAG: RsmE family RNA methyltransferase [Lachnospirales bacterium]
MQRFYVKEKDINNNTITISGDNFKHITKVLRMKIGNEIYCSYNKMDYICAVSSIEDDYLTLIILDILENDTEPKNYIHLYQGLPKQDKLEYIIQKSTEVGVSEITPVETSFCISKINKKSKDKNKRLQKIAENAAYQCGRGVVPKVNEPINFKEMLLADFSSSLNIIAYEKEETTNLKKLLNCIDIEHFEKINVFIGAEGGFAPEEIDRLKYHGFKTITLGKRILRTETAPIVLISNLIYELELEV